MTYDNFLMKEPYFFVCIPGALDPDHDTCCLQADGRLSEDTAGDFMRIMANDGANAVRILSHDPGAPHYFENLKRMAAIAHRYRLARMGYYSKELMMSRAVFYASPSWFEANVKKQHFRIRFFISDMLSERMTARNWEDCLTGFFKRSGRKPAANTVVSLRMGFETVIREKSHFDNVESFAVAWRNYTSAFPRNYGQFPDSGDPPDPDPDMPVDKKTRILELISELNLLVEASEFV